MKLEIGMKRMSSSSSSSSIAAFLIAVVVSTMTTTLLPVHGAFVSLKHPQQRAVPCSKLGVSPSDSFGNRRRTSSLQNDFRTFVNQCSIQSFMFLLEQCRDVETVKWLEKFTQPKINIHRKTTYPTQKAPYNFDDPKEVSIPGIDSRPQTPPRVDRKRRPITENHHDDDDEHVPEDNDLRTVKLLQYHGLAAMDMDKFPSWETYFLDLLEEPKVVYIVESPHRWVPDYELEIDPESLCKRLLSVRTQIAREFTKDLDAIADVGSLVLQAHISSKNKKTKKQDLEDIESVGWAFSEDDDDDDQGITARIARKNQLFLELDPDESSDYHPSPLRKGNFDLLQLLTTQEAIHRVVDDNSRRCSAYGEIAMEFLRHFYLERLESHFLGLQKYGRADAFMEELLRMPPTRLPLSDSGYDGKSVLDPVDIVEDILKERSVVCGEWKTIVENVQIDHFSVNRMVSDREAKRSEKAIMMGNNKGGTSIGNDNANAFQ